jgi:hypothetical protein
MLDVLRIWMPLEVKLLMARYFTEPPEARHR